MSSFMLQATHQMTITPQEVEGLRAVLQLLARIVENVSHITFH